MSHGPMTRRRPDHGTTSTSRTSSAPAAGPASKEGAAGDGPAMSRDEMRAWIRELHATTTRFFRSRDSEGELREDMWVRPGGGGGLSRVLTGGEIFEKAGFNRAAVEGTLEPAAAARLAGEEPGEVGAGPLDFFATGVSVVAHPQSPLVPIVHMNVRYVEITGDELGRRRWFGGGIDLTPTFPSPEDATYFHRVLQTVCSRHHPEFYSRFKARCDRYFVNTHREHEMRGVGGIFFDRLWTGGDGLATPEDVLAFVSDVGRVLEPAYGPIVDRRKDLPFGESERRLQMERRARYAEFNLIHDRGTRFGLESGARAESVLMSMPPTACWEYDRAHEAGSVGSRLVEMLEPRDWAREPVDLGKYGGLRPFSFPTRRSA